MTAGKPKRRKSVADPTPKDQWNGEPVVLTLPYPPSVNTFWRHVGNKTLISRAGRAYLSLVGDLVTLSRMRYGIDGLIAVQLDAWMPDNRRRDLDNICKAILDSLTKAGLWKDDSQIRELNVRHCGTKLGGEVTVTVSAIESA